MVGGGGENLQGHPLFQVLDIQIGVKRQELGRRVKHIMEGQHNTHIYTHTHNFVICTFLQNVVIENLCVTGTVLEAKDIVMTKKDKVPAYRELILFMGETGIPQKQSKTGSQRFKTVAGEAFKRSLGCKHYELCAWLFENGKKREGKQIVHAS